jgi:hypothetical protein
LGVAHPGGAAIADDNDSGADNVYHDDGTACHNHDNHHPGAEHYDHRRPRPDYYDDRADNYDCSTVDDIHDATTRAYDNARASFWAQFRRDV